MVNTGQLYCQRCVSVTLLHGAKQSRCVNSSGLQLNRANWAHQLASVKVNFGKRTRVLSFVRLDFTKKSATRTLNAGLLSSLQLRERNKVRCYTLASAATETETAAYSCSFRRREAEEASATIERNRVKWGRQYDWMWKCRALQVTCRRRQDLLRLAE